MIWTYDQSEEKHGALENLVIGRGQCEVQHWVQPPVPTELITVDVFSTGSVQQEPELSPLRPRAPSKTLRLAEKAVICADHTPKNDFHYLATSKDYGGKLLL